MMIKNREEILAKLTETMIKFDSECDSFQTDIYLYIRDDGTAYLDDFQNVGGNSWLNDNHYCVWSYNPDERHILDGWDGIEDVIEYLGFDADEVNRKAEECGCEVWQYLVENYNEEIVAANISWRNENCYQDYESMADACLEEIER